MTNLYITDNDRRKLVLKWVNISMWSLHAWSYMLVIAAIYLTYLGKDISTIEKMYWTSTFGIGLTIGVLLIDKFADALVTRFGTATKVVEETQTTKTTEVKK